MNTVNLILQLISKNDITEQKFLADMGFNRTLLSDWKSGKSKSYKKYIGEIASYFNVSTDYLLGIESNNELSQKPTFTISDDKQKLLAMYDLLSEREQGEIFGMLKERTKKRAEQLEFEQEAKIG